MSTSTGQEVSTSKLQRLIHKWLQNITISDFKFMAALWSSEFIRPWVQILAQDSLINVTRLQHSDSSNFHWYYISSLVLKLVITIAVSIAVDLRNHKFIVYLISLFVCSIGPIFGVITAIVQNAVLSCLTLCLTASLFVTYPTKFCLIFNQRPNALVTETREVVALFEMITSLSVLILFLFLFFSRHEFTTIVTIVVWIILVVLIAGLILITFLVRKYTTKEIIEEPNILSVLEGIRRDVVKNQEDSAETVKRKTACALRVIIFVLLLLPILVITSFDVTLTIIDDFASKNIKDDSPKKVYKFLVKLVAIPGIALFFSVARGVFGKLGDFLVIAAAHIFNTIVILLIVLYLSTDEISIDTRQIPEISRSTKLNVISGHLPNSERAVVRIFGGTEDTLFNLISTVYNTSKPDSYVEFVVDVKHRPVSFDMQIQKNGGDKTLSFPLEVVANKRYWFLLLREGDDLTELIRVYGVDEFWTHENPKLFVLNGIVRARPVDLPNLVVFDVGRNVKTLCHLTYPNQSTSVILKKGLYQIIYDTVFRKGVEFLPYTENAAVVSYFNGPKLTVHRILHIRREELTAEQSKLLHASYVLSGLTQAATNVGYLHFFWMESPVRLRTTLLACFFVTIEIVAELTKALIDEFSLNDALVYLVMSCLAGIYHISLGILYDLRFRRNLLQSGNETVSEESPAPDFSVSTSKSFPTAK